MEGLGIAVVHYFGVGVLIGCIPLVLLFVDYRRRGQLHKPLIYLAVFAFTFAVLLPFLLKSLGIWIALAAPTVVFGIVLASRRRAP